MIKFVNSPYYTDKNVEKEKGIIAEELKMYEDIPEFKLEMKLRENIYHNHPRRVDIGGSVDEIMKITKKQLYTCYNSFYSPNNMFILIVGNFDKDVASKIIHEALDDIDNKGEAKAAKIDEPKEIRLDYEEIKSSLKVPKLALGIKIHNKDLGKFYPLDLDLYLSMITTICFGSSSLFREKVRNKKLISNFYTEWESVDKMHVFYIMASSENPDELLEEIKNEFNNLKIEEADFTRMKKVWIANEVKMIDDIDSTVHNIYDDFLKYKTIIPNKIERIRNLDINVLRDLIKKIDFNNMAVVKMLPEETD